MIPQNKLSLTWITGIHNIAKDLSATVDMSIALKIAIPLYHGISSEDCEMFYYLWAETGIIANDVNPTDVKYTSIHFYNSLYHSYPYNTPVVSNFVRATIIRGTWDNKQRSFDIPQNVWKASWNS